MNKRIDEMAKDINIIAHEYCDGHCVECEHKPKKIEGCACVDIAIATGIVAKGYRKSSEVAREIFEAIYGISIGCSVENDVMRLAFEKEPYVLVVLASEFDKLRKKYESEDTE